MSENDHNQPHKSSKSNKNSFSLSLLLLSTYPTFNPTTTTPHGLPHNTQVIFLFVGLFYFLFVNFEILVIHCFFLQDG